MPENLLVTIKNNKKLKNMKTKVRITITEAEQLQQILKESGVSIPSLKFAMHQAKKKSLFERFYDRVGMFLSGGKSFSPNELKTFA